MIRRLLLASALLCAAPALAQTHAPKGPTPAHIAAPVPAATPAPPAAPMTEAVRRFDLNTATVEQLLAVEGLDKNTAVAIVMGRPFNSVEDLTARRIVPGDVFAAVKDHLVVR